MTTLIAVLALVAQPFSLVLQSTPAYAASTITVSLDNMAGWAAVDDNGKGGALAFVSTRGKDSTGSAELRVSASNQGYMLKKIGFGGKKLVDMTNLSYSSFIQQGNNTIVPSLQMDIDRNVTDGDTSFQGRLVYEPYMTSAVVDGTWQTHNVLQGKIWLTRSSTMFDNKCGQGNPCTFDEMKANFPDAGVRNAADGGIGFKAGSSWNVPFIGNIDMFTINDETYNFEAAAGPTNLGFTGSNTNGSVVKGCDAVTNRIDVTAHWAATGTKYNYRSWTTVAGSAYNSDATAYQVNDINTNSFTGTLNQGEGDYFFKVQAVTANGDISQWSTPCKVTYDITGPVTPTLVAPSNNAVVNGTNLVNSWNSVADATKYIYESYNNAAATNVRWTETTSATQKIATNVVHNTTFWWRVKAVDAQGNVGSWSELRKVTIDNVAPSQPTLTLKATDDNAPIANGSATSERFVTANWTQAAGAASYEYQYWNAIAGNAYNGEANAYKVNVGMTTSHSGEFNQGAGTHYIRVCALDAAMNRTCSNTYEVKYYKNEPALVGKNFNTHKDANYEGLNVGFRVNDFVDVTSVRVELRDADNNLIVRNEGTTDLFDLIKSGVTQLSTPFVITPADYPADPYWSFNTTNYVWAYDSPTPVTAKVFVTGTNGADVSSEYEITLTNLANQDTVPFTSLLPAYVPPVVVPVGGMGAITSGNDANALSELSARLNEPFIVPTAFGMVPTPQLTNQDTDVLGAESKEPAADQAAKSIAAAVPTESGWKIFGMMWYWWLALLAVIAAISAWLIARARRNIESQ